EITAYTNDFVPGRNVNFGWSDLSGQPVGSEVATSVTLEFRLHGITPLRALGQPVITTTYMGNASFLVPYSIPSMHDAGNYPSAGAVRIYLVNNAGVIYDPGLYTQHSPSLGIPLTYTNNDGYELQSISQVPNGRYYFLIGSVDNTQNSPDATYLASGAVDISN